MLQKGDTSGRRNEYLKAKCRELHGLPKDFNRSVKAHETRKSTLAAKKARKEAVRLRGEASETASTELGQSPMSRAPPRFDREYWEQYWRDNPQELPDIGSNIEECVQNFKEYVSCSTIVLLTETLSTVKSAMLI